MRPKNETVSACPSGSVGVTDSVGAVVVPVAPLAGAPRATVGGALVAAGANPLVHVGDPKAVPTTALPELSPRFVPVPSFKFQAPIRFAVGVVISLLLAA